MYWLTSIVDQLKLVELILEKERDQLASEEALRKAFSALLGKFLLIFIFKKKNSFIIVLCFGASRRKFVVEEHAYVS